MCPVAIRQQNNDNEFPLQLAIQQPSDFLIIQTLIELYAESLTYPHADGSYPLHKLLLQHKNEHSSSSIIRWDIDKRHDKILRDTIKSQPLFVQNIDINGNYPLHVLYFRKKFIANILLNIYPIAVSHSNDSRVTFQ
jgi:hypothetical protein